LLFDNQGSLAEYDAIVIGSGISGLTISLILAKEGQKVALFEKDPDIAPLIRPYKRKGCECSPGLHISGWMAEGEAISSFLKYLNISDGVEKELSENGFGNIIIGSNKYHFPRGFDNIEKSLLSYFPESAEAVSNYMRLIKEINEQSFYFNHKLTPSINNNQFVSAANYTLKDCLKQYHASQGLIDVLGTLNYMLIGSRADEVSFIIHAFVFGGIYRSPGFFTINGIMRLLLNFKRELAGFGVNLFLNSEIAEILIGNDRNAIGVKILNGDQYFASTIIASFNPKLLNEKVKHHSLRPVYRRRLDEAENTFGLYVAFYKLEDDQDIEIENFVYYNDSPDITLAATINRSGVHKILCVFLADNDQNIPADMEARKKRAAEKFKLLENVIYDQIPDLKGKAVLLDYLKPWSFERYTKTINGSAYGIKQTVNSIGFQHRVPIRGLYLVGQAIYPGFLGSMISSFGLACELFEVDKFWPKVTNNEIE
jgi:all-trans-retinol 13,14-reductase